MPMPQIWDVKAYNGRLLDACLALSEGASRTTARASRSRSSSGTTARRSPLPSAPFACVRHHEEVRQAGLLQGRRRAPLLGGPGQRLREVAVAMGAFDVTVVGPGGEVVAEYAREWGEAPTDSADPVLQLRLLAAAGRLARQRRPALAAGRARGVLRLGGPRGPGADLRALRDVSALSGWAAAVEGALRSLEATGGVDAATLELAAARAAAGDALVE